MHLLKILYQSLGQEFIILNASLMKKFTTKIEHKIFSTKLTHALQQGCTHTKTDLLTKTYPFNLGVAYCSASKILNMEQ